MSPHRPPLAMRLWVFRQFRRVTGEGSSDLASTTAAGRVSGMAMGIESLEHTVRNRVRLFLRHSWLVTILGAIVMIGIVWAGFYFAEKAERLRLAAGPLDGKFVQGLSDQIGKGHHLFYLRPVPTADPQATAEAMRNGRADLAVLPSPAVDAIDWPVVAILRQNVMALVVPPSATVKKGKKTPKIEKVEQLAGRRIGIVTGNEATADLLNLVLGHYGIALDKVTVSQIDPNNLADAVKNNQVDVLFVAGAATGKAISGAVAAAGRNGEAPTLIAIDQADGIAKRNPAFESVDIDAGTFGGNPPMPTESLKSLGFAEYLVAQKSFSESAIAALAKVIYTSRQALAATMPGEIKIAAPSTDKDAPIFAHPGALTYLSDSQQSFFDRYGDDIFYGLLVFPLFGSAIAGLASYLRRDTRTRRLRLLQHALDLVRKVHAAQTLEAIEHLQVDADNLVIAIIHQSEREEFDEAVRMSFAFALDQLRFAISARRTAILDHAGTAAGASSKAAAA